MNIFVTSRDPSIAPQHLDDKRLNKMILESCQILSTVMHLKGKKGPYKSTHQNHPCVKWVNENDNNFSWLKLYFFYACQEYTYRFKKPHKCYSHYAIFVDFNGVSYRRPMTFVNCTPFKQEPDVVRAYKMCLVDKWYNDIRPPKWTRRRKPEFETELQNLLEKSENQG